LPDHSTIRRLLLKRTRRRFSHLHPDQNSESIGPIAGPSKLHIAMTREGLRVFCRTPVQNMTAAFLSSPK
jgi:hypothetical protein